MEEAVSFPLNSSVQPSAAAKSTPTSLLRFIKIGIATICLFAGIYAACFSERYVAADRAVVTAYVHTVRVPIDGTLSEFTALPGQNVAAGSRLASIENDRANSERTQDLEVQEHEAIGQEAAYKREILALQSEQRLLAERAATHASAVSQRLSLEQAESEEVLAQKRVVMDQATTDLNRQHQLRDAGIISQARLEQMVEQQQVAQQDLRAQQAAVAVLKAESDAARHGIFTEQGYGSDVAYSSQRIDEIQLQLASLEGSLGASRARVDALQESLSSASGSLSLMKHADLRSPIKGTIWQIHAQEGEHLSAGQNVVDLVNCTNQFVIATVPQKQFTKVDLNGIAKIRLVGERKVITGTIQAATGEVSSVDSLAVTLPGTKVPMTVLRLSIAQHSGV